MDNRHLHVDNEAIERRHEYADLNPRPVFKTIVLSVIAGLICMACVYGMFIYFNRDAIAEEEARRPAFTERELPPAPRLQITEQADYAEFRRSADQQLNSYGWVDQEHTVAHVPIDRAIDLVLQEGLPTRKESQ